MAEGYVVHRISRNSEAVDNQKLDILKAPFGREMKDRSPLGRRLLGWLTEVAVVYVCYNA